MTTTTKTRRNQAEKIADLMTLGYSEIYPNSDRTAMIIRLDDNSTIEIPIVSEHILQITGDNRDHAFKTTTLEVR